MEGNLDDAYLGLDKDRFHTAASWEAGKTLAFCVFISLFVLAAGGLAYLPACAIVSLLTTAITYYWMRYAVLEYRHDRLKSYCGKQARRLASQGKGVELNAKSFIEFLDTPVGREVQRHGYENREAGAIYDMLDPEGDDRVTARKIHMRMSAGGKERITAEDIRVAASSASVGDCMRGRAEREQENRRSSADADERGLLAMEIGGGILQSLFD